MEKAKGSGKPDSLSVYERRLYFRHTVGEREVGVFQCASDLVVRDFELGNVELGNKNLEDVQKDAEH